ncbi:MAG: Hsp20/alpha crystallin family protein [Phycisphaerae bacterium]|nr:Hsp20/alpha crystallin family protein [Phycisphaerae bacterium]
MRLTKWRRPDESGQMERREEGPIARFRDEMDRVFGRWLREMREEGFSSFGEAFERGPSVDVAESEDDVTVKADLPGVEASDLDLSVSGNTLTIRGEKKQEQEEKKRDYQFVERRYGSFCRNVTLPSPVDPDKVDATFKNGVLTVTMAKRPEAQTKKISVKGE